MKFCRVCGCTPNTIVIVDSIFGEKNYCYVCYHDKGFRTKKEKEIFERVQSRLKKKK